jgi:hypothetical protein
VGGGEDADHEADEPPFPVGLPDPPHPHIQGGQSWIQLAPAASRTRHGNATTPRRGAGGWRGTWASRPRPCRGRPPA